MSETDSNATRP